jgi:hypothetical protein
VVIIKITEDKCCQGSEEIGSLEHCCKCKMVQATLENSIVVPQKLIMELPYDPATPLLHICTKVLK